MHFIPQKQIQNHYTALTLFSMTLTNTLVFLLGLECKSLSRKENTCKQTFADIAFGRLQHLLTLEHVGIEGNLSFVSWDFRLIKLNLI